MSKKDNDYEWFGWTVAIVIGIAFMFYVFNPQNEDSDMSNSSGASQTISEPAAEATVQSESAQNASSTWHCIDATSYNHSAYDDNKCTKGAGTQLVSDSEAVELDPSYTPGKSGAAYYNNQ